MQTLISIALLAVTFAVAFINPYYIGRVRYIGLLGLLFLLGALLWLSSIWVSRKSTERVARYSRFGRLTLPLETHRVWGRLVITDDEVCFFQRKRRKIDLLWSIARTSVGEVTEKTPRTIAMGEVLFSTWKTNVLLDHLRRSS